jgi:hypothetical protein
MLQLVNLLVIAKLKPQSTPIYCQIQNIAVLDATPPVPHHQTAYNIVAHAVVSAKNSLNSTA